MNKLMGTFMRYIQVIYIAVTQTCEVQIYRIPAKALFYKMLGGDNKLKKLFSIHTATNVI